MSTNDFIEQMRRELDENAKKTARIQKIMLIVFALFMIGLIALGYNLVQKRKAWNAWAKDHCTVVGKMEGDVNVGYGTTVSMSGKVGTGTILEIEPDKTGYKCDDGITYWK